MLKTKILRNLPLFSALFLLLFLISCQKIEDNKRFQIKGKISDGLENPVSDISITSNTSAYKLGEDISDFNGNFDFASVVPETRPFKFQFNDRYGSTYNEEWSSATYHFENKDLDGFFELDTIQLNKKVDFHFETERLSSNEPISIRVKTVKQDLEYAINFSNPGFDRFQYYNRNLDTNDPDIKVSIETVENSEVKIEYRIGNGSNQEVIIPLNQSEVTYVLSY